MTLKISLAPAECVVIGKARVENGGQHRCTLIITGNEVVLRQKRVMREREATTPMKRLYFVVQCMYLADDKLARDGLFRLFGDVVREAVHAWPSLTLDVTRVGEQVLAGNDYSALNEAYGLIDIEAGLSGRKVEENTNEHD
jgi:flagellar protein FlbT